MIIAEAFSRTDQRLQRTRLEGADGYTFTADFIAWAARQAAAAEVRGTGALDPVTAFGLDHLTHGAAGAGLRHIPTIS
ncbi:hypothetical protein [Nocardia noduli]|uniref:hypothetical protein n=1 Tax=Nocardia noduli TaxID=2815722 RepID=UPI001C23222D|nr:hypothetical protein [Nocardia noduli]